MDGKEGNAEIGGNVLVSSAFGTFCADSPDLLLRNLCAAVLLSPGRCAAFSAVTIHNILGLRTKVEMRGVDAVRHVAAMQDADTTRERHSMLEFVGEPMSGDAADIFSHCEEAMAAASLIGPRAVPQPALIRSSLNKKLTEADFWRSGETSAGHLEGMAFPFREIN